MMRVAFDYGGVLGTRPDVWRPLIDALTAGGADVYVMTDHPDHQAMMGLLMANGYDIPAERVICCDWAVYGARCKQIEVERLGIDLLIDDQPSYCAAASAECVTAMVWPDPTRPYEATSG